MKIELDTRELNGIDTLLASMPTLLLATGGPMDRAVGKAGNVVAKRARALAPNSRKSGTKQKQSAKAKSIWNKQVRSMIRSVVRRYPQTALAVIGPKAPEGNAAHFGQEKPRKHVLWGKSTSLKPYRVARDWIVQAFDETKSEQLAALEQSLRSDMDGVMRGR